MPIVFEPTEAEVEVLRAMKDAPTPVDVLARRSGLTWGAARHRLDSLDRKGLALGVRIDERQTHWTPTAKGRELRDAALEVAA